MRHLYNEWEEQGLENHLHEVSGTGDTTSDVQSMQTEGFNHARVCREEYVEAPSECVPYIKLEAKNM